MPSRFSMPGRLLRIPGLATIGTIYLPRLGLPQFKGGMPNSVRHNVQNPGTPNRVGPGFEAPVHASYFTIPLLPEQMEHRYLGPMDLQRVQNKTVIAPLTYPNDRAIKLPNQSNGNS